MAESHRVRVVPVPRAAATSLFVSSLLTAAGGFLDGFTYIGHGRVFANAMSGNVILFGAYCYAGSWHTAFVYLPPIAAFVSAIWASQGILLYSRRRNTDPPMRAVLLLEIAILLLLTSLPTATPDMVFTTSAAFAAALQMHNFREVHGRSYTSTMTTGNLRTFAEAAFTWMFEGRSTKAALIARDFAVLIGAFVLGAIAGGLATRHFGNSALLFVIAVLGLVVAVLQARPLERAVARVPEPPQN